jgi:hypothetical protein
MISNNIKKIRETKNKTRKIKDKTTTSLYLTPQERAIVCKNSANTYNTFEDKVEEEVGVGGIIVVG